MPREWFDNYIRNFGIKPDESGQEEAAFITRVLRLRARRSVLDVPCGAGRISIHLARRGIDVTGVDTTRAYIERARARFAAEGLRGRFIVRDMRLIDFQEEFDAALNWQGSFGYFDDAGNLDFLRRMTGAVKRGGGVLVDMRSREYVLRHFEPRRTEGNVVIRTTWNRRTQRASSVFTDRRTGRTWRMIIRFYTPTQFRELFAAAGLKVEGMYGDLAGGAHSRTSQRIHVLGRRIE